MALCNRASGPPLPEEDLAAFQAAATTLLGRRRVPPDCRSLGNLPAHIPSPLVSQALVYFQLVAVMFYGVFE